MKIRSALIKGTILLTAAGMLSRLIGFFYRIFLSNAFGAEAIGIYQLIGPVLALSFSITVAGLQSAISKYVAEQTVSGSKQPQHVLCTGILIALFLSISCSFLIYRYSDLLAVSFLHEKRCAPLLRIIVFALPLASLHSCFNGYFYGLKQTSVPAISQILEQLVRVFACISLYSLFLSTGREPTVALSVVGLVAGEAFSAIFSILAAAFHFQKNQITILPLSGSEIISYAQKIIQMSLPLSANRIVINLLQSYEAAQIPIRLRSFGLTMKEALSVYGTLTGMSLPLILFPNVITGSVAVLLLPTISSAQANSDWRQIRITISKCIRYCVLIGLSSTGFFLLLGQRLGEILFHSKEAGSFIVILSFLCPFLYLSTTLTSILHGLGRTLTSFFLHLICLLIRLGFVFLLIPRMGIDGYLWGLIAGEAACTLLCLLALQKEMHAP